MGYRDVASAANRFRKDSSVVFAFRKHDQVLSRIDWLLEEYAREIDSRACNYSRQRVILADLFVTCNSWVKLFHERDLSIERARYNAVMDVFDAASADLCLVLRCTRRGLGTILSEMYGRELSWDGVRTDEYMKQARYFTRKEAEIYRIRFKGSLAFQYKWWLPHPPPVLFLADSADAIPATELHASPLTPGFAGFIMTTERDLYMTRHSIGQEYMSEGIYHSAYTAGGRVSMAGTILIRCGVVLGIRSDSGHYKPGDANMAGMLQALAMHGVDLNRVKLYHFQGYELDSAPVFLKSKLTWQEWEQQRASVLQNRKDIPIERRKYLEQMQQSAAPQQPASVADADQEPGGPPRNPMAYN